MDAILALIPALGQYLTPDSIFGLAMIGVLIYIGISKLKSEKEVGSDFKGIIAELKEQIQTLSDDLKEERQARKEAEAEKYQALEQVGALTVEVKSLKQQIDILQQSVEELRKNEDKLISSVNK